MHILNHMRKNYTFSLDVEESEMLDALVKGAEDCRSFVLGRLIREETQRTGGE